MKPHLKITQRLETINLENYSFRERRDRLNINIITPLRTLHRAQLFLTLYYLQPTSREHMVAMGFTRSYVQSRFREFINADLISGGAILFKLTELGKEYVDILLQDPKVASWNANVYLFNQQKIPKKRYFSS